MANSSFKFIRVDNFIEDMNREDCFDTRDMDGISPNFKFILLEDCPQDINLCIDEDGTINTDEVTILNTDGEYDGMCSLLWNRGVNGERSISVADSTVSYDLGESRKQIKGIFLTAIADGTGYVMAYCIFDNYIEEEGTLILPVDGVVWSIRYGN